uniref:VWFA domain-containing protein n=1 Tax=Angiostrongylus cantonensis TaxID=6313 RepID=A0A158P9N4_ANGCA
MHNGHFLLACSVCVFVTIVFYCVDLGKKYENFFSIVSLLTDDKSTFDKCPLVLYNHLDPELLKLHTPDYNPKANCSVYEPFTEFVGGQVHIKEKANDYNCQARCVFPNKDSNYTAGTWIDLPSTNFFECDIVETSCIKNETIEAFLHTQIYEQKDAQKISKADVYLVILDSVSSFMAKRQWSLKTTVLGSCTIRIVSVSTGARLIIFGGTPKIAQLWPTNLAHGSMRDIYHSDEHFLNFFKSNRESIDRSFFFFMGDHGPRGGFFAETQLGQYENLNPFLMVLIPSIYRNTSIHHQLYGKANKLMTNFDLHATLMDILKVKHEHINWKYFHLTHL